MKAICYTISKMSKGHGNIKARVQVKISHGEAGFVLCAQHTNPQTQQRSALPGGAILTVEQYHDLPRPEVSPDNFAAECLRRCGWTVVQ